MSEFFNPVVKLPTEKKKKNLQQRQQPKTCEEKD